MTSNAVAIGIATYKRTALLGSLLRSLRAMRNEVPVHVYVIDNDAAGEAREVTDEYANIVYRYVVESSPGIAQARNRFLDELEDEELIIFVDDDERVDENWLTELLRTQEDYDADVVWGPVLPEFPPGSPDWATEGGFFSRQRYETGHELTSAATNNVLVRRAALERLGCPRFNVAYSSTGGSDSELFARLHASGAYFVWCDEAIVRETVPEWRMTWHWVRMRAERTGNVRARLLIADGRRAQVLIEGLARVAWGSAKLAYLKVRRRTPNAWAINPLCRGYGMLRALRGSFVHEYAREEPA